MNDTIVSFSETIFGSHVPFKLFAVYLLFAFTGLLFSLVVIMFGGVYTVFNLILDVFAQGASSTLAGFTNGQLCLIAGIVLFIFDGLCIFMIYFIKNGYYQILKLIGSLEK